MKKLTLSLFTVIMMVALFFSASAFAATGDNVGVSYSSHIQNIGWQAPVTDGMLSGTSGQGLRMEAVKINLVNAPTNANIKYQAHVQNIGWQNWVSNGAEAGTDGQSLRVEAIKISLENMPGCEVQYRVHVQNIGWQNWVSNGAEAGTDGQGLRLEAIEIKIVKTADLTAYNAALAAVTQDMVKSGWTEYQAVVAANVVTSANTQAEVDLATLTIVNAQKQLVLYADLTAYNAALAAATEENYTTATWMPYELIVQENVVTKNNTQAEVDEATANILAAQKNLLPAADLTAYNDAISIYVANGGENLNDKYAQDTWDEYAYQVEKYSDITKDTPQVTVDYATKQIANAKDKLIDFSAYTEAIKPIAANDYNTDPKVYTNKSYDTFVDEAEFYQKIAEKEGNTQSDVDYATSQIMALQDGLVVIDRLAFDVAIAEYHAIKPDQDNYSDKTWAAYEAAYYHATVEVDENDDHGIVQADYDEATAKLVDAHDKLVFDARYVADVITQKAMGDVFIGDNVLTRAQALVDAQFNGFTVTISVDNIDNGVINDAGLVKRGGDSNVTFYATEDANSNNHAQGHTLTFEVPEV